MSYTLERHSSYLTDRTRHARELSEKNLNAPEA